MILSLEGLKNKEEWEKAGVKLPSYDVEKVVKNTKDSPVWVHFGIGNIFRIFIGGIADTLIEQGLSDKGITCVETFDFDVGKIPMHASRTIQCKPQIKPQCTRDF